MQWFENIIAYLFPTVLVDRDLRPEWNERQRNQFVPLVRIVFPALAIAYMANYYLFDVPMGLEPIERWFGLRLSIALGCLATFVFYVTRFSKSKYYKLPAILMCFAVCYAQAIVCVWYGKEAWIFFFIFILVAAIVLRMSSLQTVAFGLVTIALSWTKLIEGGVIMPNIVSGSLLALGASTVIRSAAISDVRTFLLTKKNDEAQKTILNLNAEYLERFQSFIPKVLAKRLSNLVQEKRLSVVEATVEAFKVRRVDIACLFTDIRGFTQASKDIDKFINESVLPEVSACSEKIEEFDGIPRKIGDLIFAYFDSDSVHLNLVRCIAAGMEIARINESMNATSSSITIRRYILISAGEAMVGNFGNMDSSLEITALGSPVNLLSRVDELTKAPAMEAFLNHGDLIVDQRSIDELTRVKSPIKYDTIDLKELGLTMRDFPEESLLYRIKPSDQNFDLVVQMNESIGKSVALLPKGNNP